MSLQNILQEDEFSELHAKILDLKGAKLLTENEIMQLCKKVSSSFDNRFRLRRYFLRSQTSSALEALSLSAGTFMASSTILLSCLHMEAPAQTPITSLWAITLIEVTTPSRRSACF